MPKEAYQLFLDSMMIEFDQWHDGTGYDLGALGRLGLEEWAAIEELLIKNLNQAGGLARYRSVNRFGNHFGA